MDHDKETVAPYLGREYSVEPPLSDLPKPEGQLAIRSTRGVTASKSGSRTDSTSHSRPSTWSWASGDCVVGAEHAYTGSKFGTTKRHHVLSDVGSYHISVLRGSVIEDPLHKIVPILIAGNVNQRDASAITTALADTVQVAAEKVSSSNLEAFLNHLGSKLISAVLGCVANNMVNGSAAVGRSAMFANVLDAPVSKLPVSDNVDVGKNFLDARPLQQISTRKIFVMDTLFSPCPLPGNSRRYFERPSFQFRPEQPRATYLEGLR